MLQGKLSRLQPLFPHAGGNIGVIQLQMQKIGACLQDVAGRSFALTPQGPACACIVRAA